MDPDEKAVLTRKIGNFIYGKTNWLEFHAHMEECFDEENIYDFHYKEIILNVLGVKTLRILKGIIKPLDVQNEEVDYEMITKSLENHFYPKPNRVFYVTKFFLRKQKKKETFFHYVFELRKLMLKCTFGKGQHIKLRKQILERVVPDLKEKLNENGMSLSEIFEIGLLWDASNTIEAAPHPRNHRARKNRTPTCFRCKRSIRGEHNGELCPFDWSVCGGCGGKGHISIACKYKDVFCHNCKKKGHVAKLCRGKKAVVKKPAETEISTAV